MRRIFVVSVMVSVKTLGKLVVIFCVVRLSGCRNELNVTSCPDPDVNTVKWKQYDKACLDKNPTYKFHCQQNNTGLTTHLSYCAVPKQCRTGYYPSINGNTAECQRCAEGTYQTDGKMSYEYKHPSCDENWSKPNQGEVECRSGSRTEDRRFKCNWMDGYIPDSNSTLCFCFSHNDDCSCYKSPCEDGKERNKNYTCVPSTNMSTNTPRNTSMKPPTTSDSVLPVAIVVPTVAIVIAATVIPFIIVQYVRRRKRKKRDEGCQDKDEEGTSKPLISDKKEEIDNKDRPNADENGQRDNGFDQTVTTPAADLHKGNTTIQVMYNPIINNHHDRRTTNMTVGNSVGIIKSGDGDGDQTATTGNSEPLIPTAPEEEIENKGNSEPLMPVKPEEEKENTGDLLHAGQGQQMIDKSNAGNSEPLIPVEPEEEKENTDKNVQGDHPGGQTATADNSPGNVYHIKNATFQYGETNVVNAGETGNMVLGGNSGSAGVTKQTGSENNASKDTSL